MELKEQPENFNYWSSVLENMPQSYVQWFEAERRYLERNISDNSMVLEIGCGDGRSLSYISDKDCTLYGIDYSEKAGLTGRENLKILGMDANIISMEADDLIFRNNSFDYVLSLTTPANFGDKKDDIYLEMKRVLGKDGEIIISVFNEEAFDERMKVYEIVGVPIKRIEGTKFIFEEAGSEFVSEQFSRSQLEEICEHANLQPIEIQKEGIGYFCRFGKEC
jgi:ubiquinone/menaquinone biosynthesis C-methylase UbiE